jgi:polar amino acid transport system substrate-binding protein
MEIFFCNHRFQGGKRMKRLSTVVLTVFLSLMTSIIAAQTVTIYTEEFPPFNFTENGKMTGVSTEVVETVMQQVGILYDIKSLPWARTMQLAQEEPNAMIYSISRQPKREALYQWIGVLTPPVRYSVFALKDRADITVGELEDLKKYTIGSVNGDARETYLVNKGFDLGKFDRLAGDDAYTRNYQKLKAGRIELWPMPDAVAYYVVKKAGDDPEQTLRKVFEMTELSQSGYYLATGLNTPEGVVKKIAAQLETFRQSQEYQAILEKWDMKP